VAAELEGGSPAKKAKEAGGDPGEKVAAELEGGSPAKKAKNVGGDPGKKVAVEARPPNFTGCEPH
jgi:hypothetical protein